MRGPPIRGASAAPMAFLILAVFLSTLGAPAGLTAQISPWPRSGGMGGAHLALARGFEAVEGNPANLGLPGGPGWSLALGRVGVGAAVAGATLTDLADILTAGGEGDPALVARVPSGGLGVELQGDAFVLSRLAEAAGLPDAGGGAPLPSLAFTWGALGISVQNELAFTATLSRELTDLSVNGFNPERIQEYAVGATGFRGFSYTSVTLGAGYPLSPTFAVGAAVRGVLGNKLIQGRLFEPAIDLDAQSLSVSAVAVESPGARGLGLDLGAVYQPHPALLLGLSVRNAFQRLTWDEELVAYASDITDEDFDGAGADEIVDRFQGRNLDPGAATLQLYEAAQGLFHDSFLPRVVRLGGALQSGWGGSLQLAWSATQGRGRIHTTWEDRISVGVEQRLPLLSLRGGVARASSGVTALTAGVGLHLGPVELDAMAGRLGGASTSGEGESFHGLMGALGLSLRGR